MKKILFVTALLILFVAHQSFALVGLRFGANANITQPTATLAFDQLSSGDLSETFNPTGFGVTAFGMADLVLLTVTADVGYLDFGKQSYSFAVDLAGNTETVTANTHVTAIPILAGLRWEFGLPVGPKFHFGFQAGLHNFTFTYEGTAVDQKLIDEEETSSKFSVSPIIGLRWSSVDASLLYMVVEDFNYVGLRVGYTFGLGM
ncbi:hypothetical protein JXA70_09845 [candidate division KSB1 bacterium]|nr:hypothetical protein [candidate division KSB1 bacterium]